MKKLFGLLMLLALPVIAQQPPLPTIPQTTTDDLKMHLGECVIVQGRAARLEAAYIARIRELEKQVQFLAERLDKFPSQPIPAGEVYRLPVESKPK